MRNLNVCFVHVLLLAAAVEVTHAQSSLGTEFGLQGELKFNGIIVDDDCEMHFTLWNDATLSNPETKIGDTVSFVGDDAVDVRGGTFQVILGFGPDAFTGDKRWIEISLACVAKPFGRGVAGMA